jgi:hypothetical protein
MTGSPLGNKDPAGRELPRDAFVFGDALGGRVKSVRETWTKATTAAGLTDFQLRDLRHESACRFEKPACRYRMCRSCSATPTYRRRAGI